MKTILVSGASGIVGYGVLKSLRKAPGEYTLIGTTIYYDSVAPAFCDIFELAPKTSEDHYVDWLCGVIKKHKVDMIIPGIEADMQMWNKKREAIQASGVTILLNNPELIDLCSDKWLFYKKLHDAGLQLTIESRIEGTFEEIQSSFGLPFLLKPRNGFASKGISTIAAREEFGRYEEKLGSVLMAQPIVGNDNEEYSVSAFFDYTSELRCIMGLQRKLAKEGFTEKARVVNLDGAQEAIKKLAELLKPVGPTNFQFRIQENQLKLLEINPRISSATSIRAAFGYNESVMSAEYFLNDVSPAQPEIKQGYAVRYIEDYIFYDSNSI